MAQIIFPNGMKPTNVLDANNLIIMVAEIEDIDKIPKQANLGSILDRSIIPTSMMQADIDNNTATQKSVSAYLLNTNYQLKKDAIYTTYLQDGANVNDFPSEVKLNDQVILTSNGTSNGVPSEVYTYDGFRWTLTSFAGNMELNFSIGRQQNSLYPLPQYKAPTVNGEVYLFKKDSLGNPIEINVNECGNIVKLQDCEDYNVRNVYSYITKGVSLNGAFNNNANVVLMEDNNLPIGTVIDTIEIKNNKLVGFRVNGGSMIVDNLIVDNNDVIIKEGYESLDINLSTGFNNLTVRKNKHLNSIQVYLADENIGDVAKNITLTDNDFSESGYRAVSIQGSRLDYPTDLVLKNTTNVKSLGFNYLKLVGLDVNVDTTGITSIYMNMLTFLNQSQVDTLFTMIYNNGMSSGNINMSGCNFTPNSNIINLFTSKGITFTIN